MRKPTQIVRSTLNFVKELEIYGEAKSKECLPKLVATRNQFCLKSGGRRRKNKTSDQKSGRAARVDEAWMLKYAFTFPLKLLMLRMCSIDLITKYESHNHKKSLKSGTFNS